MSTEQEDVAMLLELEEKITHRIREQIYGAFLGVDYKLGSTKTPLHAPDLRAAMLSTIVNDPGFVTELTKRIGAKMANIY